MRLHVRDFQNGDAEKVARLWHDSSMSIGEAGADHPSVDDFKARLLGEAREWHMSLASIESEIVGFLAMQPETGWLRQLFVAPAMKGKGIGTALLDVAKHDMPNGFWLRTAQDNARARRFYEARGLRLTSITPHPIWGHMTAAYVWP